MNNHHDRHTHGQAKDAARQNLTFNELKATTETRGKARSAAAAGEARSAGGGAPLETYANNANTETSEGPKKPAGSRMRALDAIDTRYEKNLEKASLRASVRGITSLDRVRKCGNTCRRREGVGLVASLDTAVGERVGGWRGLYTCASVWACPRCAVIISMKRKEEVDTAMRLWRDHGLPIPTYTREYALTEEGKYLCTRHPESVYDSPEDVAAETYVDKNGDTKHCRAQKMMMPTYRENEPGEIVMLTLTMRHQKARGANSKFALEPMWIAAGKAFADMCNDRSFKGKIPAHIKAVENTYSEENGWHPHVHALLFVSKEYAQDLKTNTEPIVAAWIRAVKRKGYDALVEGQDFRVMSEGDFEDAAATMSSYVTKTGKGWGAAMEVTGWTLKRGSAGPDGEKKKGITPVDMYNVLHAAGAAEAMKQVEYKIRDLKDILPAEVVKTFWLYREYEQASRGKKQMTWSLGLREAAGLRDVSDEEAADEVAVDAENEEDVQLDQGTEEIAGFTNGRHWAAFNLVARNRLDAVKVVETAPTRSKAYKSLEEFRDGLGISDKRFKIGSAWKDHLDSFTDEDGYGPVLEHTEEDQATSCCEETDCRCSEPDASPLQILQSWKHSKLVWEPLQNVV